MEEGCCKHDALARHHGEHEDPIANRTPTTRLPPIPKIPIGARTIIELRDPDNAEETAIFFETLAKLIRLRRRIVLICE